MTWATHIGYFTSSLTPQGGVRCVKSSQQASGKILVLFSQPGQSLTLFPPGGSTRRETKGKISQEKQKRQILNKPLLSNFTLFMFARSKVSSEQIFQRTAVVDYSRRVCVGMGGGGGGVGMRTGGVHRGLDLLLADLEALQLHGLSEHTKPVSQELWGWRRLQINRGDHTISR